MRPQTCTRGCGTQVLWSCSLCRRSALCIQRVSNGCLPPVRTEASDSQDMKICLGHRWLLRQRVGKTDAPMKIGAGSLRSKSWLGRRQESRSLRALDKYLDTLPGTQVTVISITTGKPTRLTLYFLSQGLHDGWCFQIERFHGCQFHSLQGGQAWCLAKRGAGPWRTAMATAYSRIACDKEHRNTRTDLPTRFHQVVFRFLVLRVCRGPSAIYPSSRWGNATLPVRPSCEKAVSQ